MGPPSGAARDALRGALLILPRRDRRGGSAAAQLRGQGSAGDARGQRVRRRRHGTRSAQLLPARHQLGRGQGSPGAAHDRTHRGGFPRALLPEDHERSNRRSFSPVSARLLELLDLSARWVHVIAAIMWIGNSLLFNWLDRTLAPSSKRGEGLLGESWLLHSGGFYFVEKTQLVG